MQDNSGSEPKEAAGTGPAAGRTALALPDAAGTTARLEALQASVALEPLAVYLTSLAAWRAFMRLHVFAVWDFMSLLKRLQAELTTVTVPWLPKAGGAGARLIGEIVLAEESDEDGAGGYCSHFALYRRAMLEAGADVAPIDGVVAAVRAGQTAADALAAAPVQHEIRAFVAYTLKLAQSGSVVEVAAAFLYGREAVLPTLFASLLAQMQQKRPELALLAHYFARHIALDADDHGPKAHALLAGLCGQDADKWRAAEAAAAESLRLRRSLWRTIGEAAAAAGRPPTHDVPKAGQISLTNAACRQGS